MKPDPFSPARILLVNDNADGILVRRLMLEEAGYVVETARDGEQALERFASSTFDVVITDYRMPGMNGVEVIGHIRKVNPDAKIVLLSGFVEILGLTEQNTGANAVVAKNSSEPAYLMRWVKRLVNGGPARKPVTSQRRAASKLRAVGS